LGSLASKRFRGRFKIIQLIPLTPVTFILHLKSTLVRKL